METRKEIASGGWIVSETIDCYGNCPEHKTIVTGFGGRIIGKFDDRISVSDARMIANAPNMLGMMMLMESALSLILFGESPSVSKLGSILVRARRIIDNVK